MGRRQELRIRLVADISGIGITSAGNVIGVGISGVRNIIYNSQPLPQYLQGRGSTTYLTISSYKENYTVTATYIPSDSAFRPSFPTGFMPIDEEFVKKAIIGKFDNSFDNSEEYKILGAIIYNYFIPPAIRQYIGKSSPDNLVIQTSTEHDIPWELTYDGEEFWCIKYNMGRALGTEDETESGQISKLLSGIRIAIISNPEGNLDGASKEAKLIESLLDKEEQITVDIFDNKEATKLRVLSIITSGNYDVLHYTGHAKFNAFALGSAEEEPSSLKLHDNELTANEIIRLKFNKTSRPIIFANSCSSSTTRFVGDKTVGLAAAFIVAGALGYVGTMWPVQDNSAANFAADFYRHLKTKTIGEALKQSRINARSSNSQNNEWAPYSFFGDPRHNFNLSSITIDRK